MEIELVGSSTLAQRDCISLHVLRLSRDTILKILGNGSVETRRVI